MEIPKMYLHHEKKKKDEYNARILEIEQGSFTPLVLSCSGGLSRETDRFLKRLAQMIALKRKEEYCHVVSFLRRRIRFDLLKACVISLRGERKGPHNNQIFEVNQLDFGLVQSFDGL